MLNQLKIGLLRNYLLENSKFSIPEVSWFEPFSISEKLRIFLHFFFN